MSQPRITIGSEFFRRIREEHALYMDKTSLIEELLRNKAEVSLITRPRRFGKTLTMTMLRDFFDIRQDSRAIFEGLDVARNKELCDAWMNQYPTVFLTLKGVEGLTLDEALYACAEIIGALCAQHSYLYASPHVEQRDKEMLHELESTEDKNLLAKSINTLCRALHAHYRKPVILLIDEYDVPLAKAQENGYYREMVSFLRGFLGGALKTNPSLALAVLTGCLRISKESIFTGLNNFACYTISDAEFADKIGFTSADVDALLAAAARENLESYPVASVTAEPRMVMTWRGQTVASLSRAFLNTNGAAKHARVSVPQADAAPERAAFSTLREMAASLKCASRRGLTERFDGSIGAGSVLMPFGGKTQRTPAQAMAALFPVEPGQETGQASVMAWGCDPEALSADPYQGAKDAVYASVAKLVAAGADYRKAYLTLQEFFEKLRDEPARWGKPFAALLGALDAQLELGCAAIGGKDSMSGTFHDLDVPPTLISFAIAPIQAGEVLSPEFKEAGHPVYLFVGDALAEHPLAAWDKLRELHKAGKVKSAWAVEHGFAETVMNMSFGNRIGFAMGPDVDTNWYTPWPRSIVAELTEELDFPLAIRLGATTAEPVITIGGDSAPIDELLALNERVLEDVYPTRAGESAPARTLSWDRRSPAVCKSKTARPRVAIPVFPGTNCEYDSARACLRAGLEPEIVVVRNLTASALEESALALEKAIRAAQILFLPGGFSGGDEPDGSAKFICSFLRNGRLTDAVHDLLKRRDGLMLGICNGFQALIKLGLVPYGEIRAMDEGCPTLTFNTIGRHQSRYVTTRVASVQSPWMLQSHVGDLHAIPISHGEGRFTAPQAELERLIANGQIATQYVDASGAASMDIDANPNGSLEAIEGIFSPDGRVFGKMGHSERRGPYVGVNIPGDKHQPLFESGAAYFR